MAASLRVGELDLIAGGERTARLPDHARQANGISDAREGVVQITGREHAEHLAGGLDEQVLGGLVALDSLDELHAGQVSGKHESPGSMVRASEPTSTHGRRCCGVAITAVSLTIAIGVDS